MVMIMMDDPKADGQWGFHHNQTHCYWWLYRLSHLCELQSEVSTDFYEKTWSQNFLPFPDLHWDNLQETSIFFHIYIYCKYIYIYIYTDINHVFRWILWTQPLQLQHGHLIGAACPVSRL